MGKCVRIVRGGSNPPPPAAASCLTLRSGRRVPPPACGPRTSGRPRRHHRGSASLRRWCGSGGAKAADNKLRACGDGGSPRRRSAGRTLLGAQRQLCGGGQPEEEEVLPARAADAGADDAVARGGVDGRGDSFERLKTPPMTDDDCDAAAVKVSTKLENESPCRSVVVVAGQTPPEAEIEAFFVAAELAERRRFAETYNYDVALDRPLEGRFVWEPVST